MTAPAAHESFHVSPGAFRLLTDCIRIRCDHLSQLRSPSAVLEDLLESELTSRPIDGASLVDHFVAQPAGGDITLSFGLGVSASNAFGSWICEASQAVGRDLSREEALSALLFFYRVEREVAMTLARLQRQAAGIDDAAANRLAGNVVIFPDRHR